MYGIVHNADTNLRVNNNKPTTIKSFEHKAKIIGRTQSNKKALKLKFVAPSKYVSNF